MGFRSRIFRTRTRVSLRQRAPRPKGKILKRCNSLEGTIFKVMGIYHFRRREVARSFYAKLLTLVRECSEEDVKHVDTSLEKA